MKEQHVRWYSTHLSRDFEMITFGDAGYPVIVFPASLGRHHQVRDFKLLDSAAHLVKEGKLKIYCPDGIDGESWYNKTISPADRVRAHMAYEQTILNDVVSRALKETGQTRVAVAGPGFGGYHAMNFALRHPDRVGYCICLGGSFDIRSFLDDHYDEDCYFNNPVEFLPNLNDAWFLGHVRRMGIILGTGDRDGCRERNHEFSRLLTAKGVPHFLDDRKWCGHDWSHWREMFAHYLSLIHPQPDPAP